MTEEEEEATGDIAELVAQCQHHKGAAKKGWFDCRSPRSGDRIPTTFSYLDAVASLRQYLVTNVEQLGRQLGVIVEALAPLIVDEVGLARSWN